ncbi:MAG: c-type cytochrome domain-containing protein [Planctomycetota bacterium]
MRYFAAWMLSIVAAGPALAQEPAAAQPADAVTPVDFTKQIAPILVERCIECHGPKEQEGDLRLDAKEFVFAEGDEDFWTVYPKDAENSELLRRLGLPLDDEEVMPAKGEPLSKAQQALFDQWVKEGATWPAAGDEFIQKELAAQVLPKITFELPEISEPQQQAIERAMAELRELGGVVQRVAADTSALDVNLSLLRDKADDDAFRKLEALAPVLVWLNVSRTAITDESAVLLGKLTQLRRLNLAGTKLGRPSFQSLAAMKQLEYLNAYATSFSDDELPYLLELPALRKFYAWQSKVTKGGVKAAQDHFARFETDLGDYVETRLADAKREIAAREARNTPCNETCPVSDEPVDKAHFVEHEGRRVAFCCAKCKAAFEKDPAKYAGKLPGKSAGEKAGRAGQSATGQSATGQSAAETGGGKGAPINERCPVSGAKIDAAHTSEHEGRLVAFCCGKCKAKFDQDPAKFAAKLPGKK